MRFIAIVLLWLCFSTTYAANILVINSYYNDFPWSQKCIKGLTDTIDTQHKLTYFEMDTKHIPAEQFQAKAEEAWQLFEKMQPDLVITMDDNALKFLGERIANTGTPVVFMGVSYDPNKYFAGSHRPDNVSGMLERRLIAPALKAIIDTLSSTPQKMLFLMDNSVTSQVIIDNIFSGKHTLQYRNITKLDVDLISDFTTWQRSILNAKQQGYAAVIVTNMFMIKGMNNKFLSWDTILKWTTKNSPVPVFSDVEFFIGKDYAIGGVVISPYHQGMGAARKANAVLTGKKSGGVSMSSKYEYLYSQSELARWGLTLPKRIARKARLVD